jgi:hypothetical protein
MWEVARGGGHGLKSRPPEVWWPKFLNEENTASSLTRLIIQQQDRNGVFDLRQLKVATRRLAAEALLERI